MASLHCWIFLVHWPRPETPKEHNSFVRHHHDNEPRQGHKVIIEPVQHVG